MDETVIGILIYKSVCLAVAIMSYSHQLRLHLRDARVGYLQIFSRSNNYSHRIQYTFDSLLSDEDIWNSWTAWKECNIQNGTAGYNHSHQTRSCKSNTSNSCNGKIQYRVECQTNDCPGNKLRGRGERQRLNQSISQSII